TMFICLFQILLIPAVFAQDPTAKTDYINPTPTPFNISPTGRLVGIIVGAALLGLGLTVGLVLLIWRIRRGKGKKESRKTAYVRQMTENAAIKKPLMDKSKFWDEE
ncbi:hypothetical protein HDU93_006893, partial [Gonapodya sp. JEL0774]